MGADLGDHSGTPSYQSPYLNIDGKSAPVYYNDISVLIPGCSYFTMVTQKNSLVLKRYLGSI